MKISELVRKTQVPKETIHYYIREGILPKPEKTGKNVANYDDTYIDRIKIIRNFQDKYFFPLSVIKKILNKYKKKSMPENLSFNIQSEFFRPIDLLLSTELKGEEAFMEETGLGKKWLDSMEEWEVVCSEEKNGEKIYSRDDVIIGKLIFDMDQIGIGPKDGQNPEDLRKYISFLREVISQHLDIYLNRTGNSEFLIENVESGTRFTEIMSLFLYHLYRKTIREEILSHLDEIKSADEKNK